MTEPNHLRGRLKLALMEADEMSAFQIARSLGMARATAGLRAALRTAERNGEVFTRLVDATHFHSFQRGKSTLYSLTNHVTEPDDDDIDY